jgi:hypothetical protein
MMAIMKDEDYGKGGTYEVDPKTGQRKLVPGSRTEPAFSPLQSETAPAKSVPPAPAPEPTSKS